LGWSHGDTEIFTKEQFVNWFDLEHLGRSPAQHNPEKLIFLNHHYIANGDAQRLAALVEPFALERGIAIEHGPDFVKVVALLKDRANTLLEIADGAKLFYMPAPELTVEQLQENIPEAVRPAIRELMGLLITTEPSKESIAAAMKLVLTKHGLKMPALAMPIRYALFATTQTPALDAVIAVMGIDETMVRLKRALS
jgi:glutamyl-tRNA synthetase